MPMNQRGFSLLSLLIALVIIMIISAVMFKTLKPIIGNKTVKENSAEKQAIGISCRQNLTNIASWVDNYRDSYNGTLPMSMATLASTSSAVSSVISDTTLWAETENMEDNPKFKSYHDEYFVIEAYCNDGYFYTYDSRENKVTSEPFVPQEPAKK